MPGALLWNSAELEAFVMDCRTNIYASPLGNITLACQNGRLTGLWFEGQKYFGSTLTSGYSAGNAPVLDQTRTWLDCYFQGRDPGPLPPLELQGTSFQREIWELLLQIPRGQVTTYGRLAKQVAVRRGLAVLPSRAVGSAVGRNPISILVPCHRVLGSDGNLRGYAGGLDRKKALLELEKAGRTRFYV